MNLIDFDAIQLATDKQPYNKIVENLQLQLKQSIFTGVTAEDGQPEYKDFISFYGRLKTLIDAAESLIKDYKQEIHNEAYRLYPEQCAKGKAFTHNGGSFVLRTQEVYNYLPYDVPVVVKAKNGKAIRRRVLGQMYNKRDSMKAALTDLSKDIKRHESMVLAANGPKMQPTDIKQTLAYI